MDKMSNTAHEYHVMGGIHDVEDYAIDMAHTLHSIPEGERDKCDCETMMMASDMLKDMMEARKNISKIRYYEGKMADYHMEEPWETEYASVISQAETLVYNLRCWMKHRYMAAHTNNSAHATTAEKHLSEAFAAHKVLTGMVMAVDATAGEKEIIMNHVKATK